MKEQILVTKQPKCYFALIQKILKNVFFIRESNFFNTY